MIAELKPCPFCGSVELPLIRQGSSHRWIAAECTECGAVAPEVKSTRYQSPFDPQDVAKAMTEWNDRVMAPSPVIGSLATIIRECADYHDGWAEKNQTSDPERAKWQADRAVSIRTKLLEALKEMAK